MVIRLINALSAIVLALVSLVLFNGCATKDRIVTHTVYQDVYLIKPCDIEEPNPPIKQENSVMAVIELKDQLNKYKVAFRSCKGETTSE